MTDIQDGCPNIGGPISASIAVGNRFGFYLTVDGAVPGLERLFSALGEAYGADGFVGHIKANPDSATPDATFATTYVLDGTVGRWTWLSEDAAALTKGDYHFDVLVNAGALAPVTLFPDSTLHVTTAVSLAPVVVP